MTDPGHDLYTALRDAQATNPAAIFDDLAEQLTADPETRARYDADVERHEAQEAGGELFAGLIADAIEHSSGASRSLAARLTTDEGNTA